MRPGPVPALLSERRNIVVPSKKDGALEDCELRLRAIIDTVPEAILIIDEMGLIESFSQAASRLFGYESDEVTGQNVGLLLPQPHRDQFTNFSSAFARAATRALSEIVA